MTWFRKQHDPPPAPAVDRAAAKEAREEAEAELAETRARRSEVSNAVARLRVMRERNGFADIIYEALSGTRDDKRAE